MSEEKQPGGAAHDPAPIILKEVYELRFDEADQARKEAIWRELGLSEARTVLGMRIKNEQGRDVGELDNLLIDTQSGRISHVVIGVGGEIERPSASPTTTR